MGKSVPIINQWYQDIAVNRLFEVIAVDEYSTLIDIRYETNSLDNNSLDNNNLDNNGLDNSDLNSISFDDWSKMIIVSARAPEDWRSSFAKSHDDQLLADDLSDKIVMPNPDSGSIDSIETADYLFGWDEF
jgi:hypothetical protein